MPSEQFRIGRPGPPINGPQGAYRTGHPGPKIPPSNEALRAVEARRARDEAKRQAKVSQRAEAIATGTPRGRAVNEIVGSRSAEIVGSRRDERRGRFSAPTEALAPLSGSLTIPRGTPRGAIRDEHIGVRNVFKSLGTDQDRADAFANRLMGRD